MTDTLPRAHGGPPLQARLRDRPEDFVVVEDLGLVASGEGEHQFLRVRKRGTNTDWLAGRLAEYAGVRRGAVSYAGLKDRHAVTEQTFSIHLPGVEGPDWSAFAEPEVEILAVARHHRKLRRGSLAGNDFVICLRDVAGDIDAAQACLAAIKQRGVPNYFGEQRFGRGGNNVDKALAFFTGRRVPRKQQGMLISAARSHLFNALLAERVTSGNWDRIIDGEICCLQGSRSWFLAEQVDEALEARARNMDVHPSGPLWGRGALETRGEAAALENRVAAGEAELVAGLCQQKLEHDRRPLRLLPAGLRWEWAEENRLILSFSLPAGAYATTLLRELVDWSDA